MKTKTTFKHLNNSPWEKIPVFLEAISSYLVQLVIKKTNSDCIAWLDKILVINFVPPSSLCIVVVLADYVCPFYISLKANSFIVYDTTFSLLLIILQNSKLFSASKDVARGSSRVTAPPARTLCGAGGGEEINKFNKICWNMLENYRKLLNFINNLMKWWKNR